MIVWALMVSGVLLVALIPHTRPKPDLGWCIVGSVAQFIVLAVGVTSAGAHLCYQGVPPSWIALTAATAVALSPWLLRGRPKLMGGLTVGWAFAGILTASYLASSYHRPDITGNPDYAAGRFWHTGLTGQYPRDATKSTAGVVRRN